MIVRELLKQAERRLEEADKEANNAKVLFYHLSQKEPHELYLMMDEEVDPEVEARFNAGMQECLNGKPVQYIIGKEYFFGREFIVDENVLIPRPETEELVENVLYCIDDYFEDTEDLTLCDVGTGSGAIAISLKAEEPRMKMYATDISNEALEVAAKNAKMNEVEITFKQGDMCQPLLDLNLKVDIFVSNPPYIPSLQNIDSLVKDNEPHVALFGGEDGLYFYRKIFSTVEPLLKDRAIMAFEMGFDQREAMEAEVKKYFPDYQYRFLKDMSGKNRMLFIYKNLEIK